MAKIWIYLSLSFLAAIIIAVSGMNTETEEESTPAKRTWRQWVRMDKTIYRCKNYVNPYYCSCQYLMCNHMISACGPCIVKYPYRWKNAIYGRDCVCSYSKYYGK